jgi:hypothetical protein
LDPNYQRIIGDQNYIKSNIVMDQVRVYWPKHTHSTLIYSWMHQWMQIPYSILPLHNFPNGAFWMANAETIADEAYIIHFTHIKGHLKKTKMREYGMWFLQDGDEPRRDEPKTEL